MASKQNLRSISLPSRSNPTTLRVEEKLNNLKSRITSIHTSSQSRSVCSSLSGLQELYNAMNDMLNMSSTQELLSRFRGEKCVEELLDGSVGLLDLCGNTRDMLLQLKEHIQALQSAFRRRKGSSEKSIQNYNLFRKKMKKDVHKFIARLKQLEIKVLENQDCHLIQLFKDVFVINSVIFQTVMVFLCGSSKPKRNGWLMISKLMHRGSAVTCEEHQESLNEMASVDHALLVENFECENAQKRLEDLEKGVDETEKFLEGVFRNLIKTRASILNIISL
ncbi:hypothetical protein M5689_014177 [Euphorbia peplus]|nr:hypothetical protein M5689_014177 [Euphorbia peplus]